MAQQQKKKLQVEVISASDLPPKDNNGLSDPYVIIKLGTHESKTEIVKKELNPKFNYKTIIEFTGDHTKEKIEFHVYDDDLIGKDDIGTVTLPLSPLFIGKRVEYNETIKLATPYTKVSKLKVALTALDFGPKDTSEEDAKRAEEARKKADEEKKKKEDEEKKKKDEEAKKKADEEKKKKEDEEKKKKADEEKKKEEEAKKKTEEEKQKRENEQQQLKHQQQDARNIFFFAVGGVILAGFAFFAYQKFVKKN
jgi:flagellar biosynthesis GTPase FlhF